MNNITSVDIVLSFIVTWIVGLTPPILIRYLLYRKPVSRKVAIFLVVFLYFLNLFFFIILGSVSKTHAVLFLIAWISYRILLKESKTEKISPTTSDKEYEKSAENILSNKKISKNNVLTIIGLFIVLLFAYAVWPTPYRYDRMQHADKNYIVRINRLTGAGEILGPEGWESMKRQPINLLADEPVNPKKEPINLLADEPNQKREPINLLSD